MRTRSAAASGLQCALAIGFTAACLAHEWGVAEAAPPAPRSKSPRTSLERAGGGIAFVDESSCAGCHAAEAEAWKGSHHDLAMAVATPETVLGDFDDSTFLHHGVSSRFFRRNGGYWVRTEGRDGEPADFQIAYTFGIEPLQQYLVAFPGGRLQVLWIAWDTREGRWFHLYPDQKIAAGDALHWTGRYQTWNLMCAECHSTDLRKRYDATTDRYDTTWARIDVGCQACHGPAARHVAWSKQTAGEKPAADDGLVVHLSDASAPDEVDACARCHARRHRVSPEDFHGRPFLDQFAPELLRPGLYAADGQIEAEVYVYGSFLQSRMYAAGVRCRDCHDPHSLTLREPGNALCGQCHGEAPPRERFPTLAARAYDSPDHHLHEPGTPGSGCVDCHMPERTYMIVDPRRDHSLRIPRPDLSQRIGTPNACTGCHTDRTAGWAVEILDAKKGQGWRRGSPGAAAFHDARDGSRSARQRLEVVANDAAHAPIVRATALEQLRNYGSAAQDAIAKGTRDEAPLVRAAAAGGLDRLPPETQLALGPPLLRDPTRAVRVQAARALAPAAAALDEADRAALVQALAELREAELSNADRPDARANLAMLAQAEGRGDEAVLQYEAALELDPAFFPASLNLATLHNAGGRNADAERVLRAAIEQMPEQGELWYSLGLLLAEDGKMDEAASALGEAARRMPDRSRVRYNHGLALQHLGRRAQAEPELLAALRLEPDDPAISQALVSFYVQGGRFDRALPHAERLAMLVPDAPGVRAMLQQIQQRAGTQ